MLVIDSKLVKLFSEIAIQRSSNIRHMDFDDAFVNEKLEREEKVEFSKHGYSDKKRRERAMRLRKSLYGILEASKVRNEFLA